MIVNFFWIITYHLMQDDRTPLFTAALYGNEDVVRYLLSQILVNKVDKVHHIPHT